jgi:Flp pilus assembly CpaE family ATPase
MRTVALKTQFQRAVLISPHSEIRQSIIEAAGDQLEIFECREAGRYPEADAVLGQRPDLCLIDVGTNIERALALIRETSDSGTPVIALNTAVDSDLILRSLRCGAVEFFSIPIETNSLFEALKRISRKDDRNASKSRTGKVWVIMPAKPNYGSTTVACNLAARARKLESRRVLLVDMDPLLGSVAFLLGLRGPFSIIDAISGSSHLDRDLWKKLILEHGGLDILSAPESPQPDHFDVQAVNPLLKFFRENYAISIIDSPGPVSEWQLKLASEADELIIITTNELAAIHATQRTLRRLETAGIARSRIRLVINRYLRENGLSEDAIETGLKVDVFHVLPNDYEGVQAAILEAKTVSPASRLSRALDELCERLTGFTQAPKKSWMSSVPHFFLKKR